VALGTVKWFDAGRGHGYVVPDGGGRDLYLHRVSVARDLRPTLAAGDRLEFETRFGGVEPEAVNAFAPDTDLSAARQIGGRGVRRIEAGQTSGNYDLGARPNLRCEPPAAGTPAVGMASKDEVADHPTPGALRRSDPCRELV
jgi:CspA family cold shock protein